VVKQGGIWAIQITPEAGRVKTRLYRRYELGLQGGLRSTFFERCSFWYLNTNKRGYVNAERLPHS
jgi:hypothetical protein